MVFRSQDQSTYITIGTIIGTVGLSGEVKCFPETFFPERFFRLCDVRIEAKDGKSYPLRIKQVRLSSSFVFILFEGIDSLENATPLKGSLIQIPEEERLSLPPDHYYRYEIVGLDVYLADRTNLGKVDSILSTGANDVYIVRNGSREHLIPALKRIIRKIDLKRREMVIDPIPGLLDASMQ